MTIRPVPTPLDGKLEWPEPREGGLAPELLSACLAGPGTQPALARLAAPGALTVTTGQQPGLFTGPLYTIYKAISAVALAEVLERRWARPVIPIFWVAGDDHDFAEANHTAWIAADGTVSTATLRARPSQAPLRPLYQEPVGAEIAAILDQLRDELPASEFRADTLGWLARHYQAEQTLAAAFAGALAELLAPLGLVCFDSTHPAVKRAMAPLLVRSIGLAPQLDRDLVAQAQELQEEGKDPGVPVGDGATLVMLESSLGRDRLIIEGPEFVTRRSGERFDRPALERIAAETPGRLSPNVLLRPVIESALLPTVAYVGGPSELRYLDLSRPIYQRLRIPRQPAVPRWSGVLLEPKSERVLDKFDATLDELVEPNQALESRVIRSQLPEPAVQALGELRQTIERAYAVVARAAADIDPTMEKPVLATRTQALNGTREIEKRLIQHLKRRQETEVGQIAKARMAVLPNGKPQERVLNIASFLARYGPPLLLQIREEMSRWYAEGLEGVPVPS